jgi:hypothetical protein
MSDDNKTPRNASDVLLDIESKVDTLQKIYFNNDLNLKILTNGINKLNSSFERLEKLFEKMISAVPDQPAQQSQPEFKDYDKQSSDPLAVKSQEETVEVFDAPLPPNRSKKVTPEHKEIKPAKGGKKIPISQRITKDGKDNVFMANVFVIDSDGQTIEKAKTNASGIWQALVAPGTYSIRVVKGLGADKKEVMQDNITITESTSTLPVMLMR